MNPSRPRRARRIAGVGVVALLAGIAACYAPSAADATVTSFALSPHAGPPGAVVHVSGAGCNPGLLGSEQTDFVNVTAPSLRVLVRVPVGADGSWSGSFTVPADGIEGAAPVAAACISSGLSSLTTTYTPQTFTVTRPPPTTPGTSTTRPRSSTTHGTNPSNRHPATTVFVPDHPSVVVGVPSSAPHVTDGTTGPGVTNPADSGTGTGSHAASTSRPGSGAPTHSVSPGSATLQQADLGSYAGSGDGGGLGWLSGLLLLALLIAACGATVLIRRARRAREAAAESETA